MATPPAHGGPVRVRRLGIDTHQEPVVYLRRDSPVCRSEGFEALARVRVDHGSARHVVATLNVVSSGLVERDEAGLSESAFRLLGAAEGDRVRLSHPEPVTSFGRVRAKIFGHELDQAALSAILADVITGRYLDVQVASFLTACAARELSTDETVSLTRAMIAVGERIEWGHAPIVDKHGIGGLPGNRTTPILVPIVAEAGLTIPKTSSRAITSPAGTADTMAVMTPVDLDLQQVRSVVGKVNGCIVWGGAVGLSPADDLFIRVERTLDLDTAGQLVASVISKKAAAGSTHVLIDLPVGATAKVRSTDEATALKAALEDVGRAVGLTVSAVVTDGSQPVGRGMGPCLEAADVLAVLRGEDGAPADLRERALLLAGGVIDMAGGDGDGATRAARILDSGRAFERFRAICEAQGGFSEPWTAPHRREVGAPRRGRVIAVDNRRLARVAKLAGAPADPGAGLQLHVRVGDSVDAGQPLCTVHAQSPGELQYALHYLDGQGDVIGVMEGA